MEAARHEAPQAPGEVVQHGEAERAHADADPEEEAEEVGAEELAAVRREAGGEGEQEDPAHDEAGSLELLEGGALVRGVHQWCSGAGARAAARLRSSSGCLSAGTSAAGAYWLYCSVRTYAAIAQRSAGGTWAE